MREFFAPGASSLLEEVKLLEVGQNVVRALDWSYELGGREEIDGFWVPHRLFCDPGSWIWKNTIAWVILKET